MVDHISPEHRSRNMSLIRSKDTRPEITVRSVLHRLGYRFRKNVKKLPGTPDIVLPKYKTIIFVHGCFWHCHEGCRKSNKPKSNSDYWNSKLLKNMERDIKHQKNLADLGWQVSVIWECETKNKEDLESKLLNILHTAEKNQRKLSKI
jgi:DNA mismatch endonuclease, patch repair protein